MNDLFSEEGQSTPLEKEAVVLPEVEETEAATEVAAETTETTEAKAEETTAETEEKPKSLFDQFKKPNEDATTEKEEKTEVVDGNRVAELEEKLKKYDTPLAKLLGGDYDLTNVDIKDLLRKAVGEDYSNLSNENLIAKALNSDPDFLSLTPEEQKEEIETRLASLEGMSKYEVQKERSKMLNELNKASDPSELVKALEEVKESQKNGIKEPEKWYEEKVTQEFNDKFQATKAEISNLAKGLVGQEYNGFAVTEEIANEIAGVFEDQTMNFSSEKATINAFKIATYDKWGDERERIGYEKAMKEKMNPSTNTSTGAVIVTRDPTSMEGATKDDFFAQANS